MSQEYSLEIVYKISDSDRLLFEIGDDRDSLELFEIRNMI